MQFTIPQPGSYYPAVRVEWDSFPQPAKFDFFERLQSLTELFEATFRRRVSELEFPAILVRARLPCNSVYLVDADTFWIVSEVAHGSPLVRVVNSPDLTFSQSGIETLASWDFGYFDAFYVRIPRNMIDMTDEEREANMSRLEAAADELIAREHRRYVLSTQGIRLDPLFGPPPVQSNPTMCFVICPFSQARSQVYQDVIKVVVEENGLACRRADDMRTNRAIMENIWRSICEARFLIADLTGANANVFYELGIAHTVGKDVILIEERPAEGETHKRPFDTMGIDAVLYRNDGPGWIYLRNELDRRIKGILERTSLRLDDVNLRWIGPEGTV